MGLKRKPYQGVFNIIRFNWHFYVALGALLFLLAFFRYQLPLLGQTIVYGFVILSGVGVIVSLITSFVVYDLSDIYELKWLPRSANMRVLNVNAGFDETSEIIIRQMPDAELAVCDFYDPEKHTEVSIKRARKVYPPYEHTLAISTAKIPFENDHFDYVLAFLSAHEIRNRPERVAFFRELARAIKPGGQLFVTEHLRDLNNFLAYTIGALHFHSRSEWLATFTQAGWMVRGEKKTTPFVTTFILEKDGDTR